MYWRQRYRTAQQAQKAMSQAVNEVTERLRSGATEAGSVTGDAICTVVTETQSVRQLTVASVIANGELPEGAIDMYHVVSRIITPFKPLGEVVSFTQQKSTRSVEQPSSSIVTISVDSSVGFKIKFKATIAAKVRAYFNAIVLVPINTEIQDPGTHKLYKTSANFTPGSVGYHVIDVIEVDSNDRGETTRGAPLYWISPVQGMEDTATVVGMKAATVSANKTLRDSVGRVYKTGSTGVPSSTSQALFGDVYSEVPFSAMEEAAENVKNGTSLTLDSGDYMNGLSVEAEVSNAPEIVVPKNSRILFTGTDANAYYARTQLDAVIKDTGLVQVGAVTETIGKHAVMTPGNGYSFLPSVSGASGLVCDSIVPAKFFPIKHGLVMFGAPLEIIGRVRRESDGRYAAIVNTSPAGT